MITVDKSKFLYISKFVSNEQARYYLTGVYFENNGTMTATDGHCLGTLKNAFTKNEDFTNFILPASKDLISLLKKEKSETFEIELLNDNFAKIICGCMSLNVNLIDGTYPDYKRVIPTEKKENKIHTIGFNANYMQKFVGYTKKDTNLQVIFGEDETCPILVKNGKLNDDFIGVIMPVRI